MPDKVQVAKTQFNINFAQQSFPKKAPVKKEPVAANRLVLDQDSKLPEALVEMPECHLASKLFGAELAPSKAVRRGEKRLKVLHESLK